MIFNKIVTNFGNLKIGYDGKYICSIEPEPLDIITSNINQLSDKQLEMDIINCLHNKSTKSLIKIKIKGSEFQRKVWKEILKIKPGTT